MVTLLILRDHPFMTSILKEDEGGDLKFVTCLWLQLFLNNRSIVHFCGWRGCWGHKIGHFFVDVINVQKYKCNDVIRVQIFSVMSFPDVKKKRKSLSFIFANLSQGFYNDN